MKPTINSLLLILLVIAVTACTPGNAATVATVSPNPTSTAAPAVTKTPRPPTVTAIPAATQTSTPIATPTRTPFARPTTLSPATLMPVKETPVTATTTISADLPLATVGQTAINVRSGPGVVYPVVSVLPAGETVQITGLNHTAEWFRVSSNGTDWGWITANPFYVTASSTATVPVVPAPPLPQSSSTPTTDDGSASGKLILQSESGGEFYLLTTENSVPRLLSRGIDPTLSPDGRKVAFTRWTSGDDGSLWVLDLATGKETALLGEMRQAKSPTWSPDGAKIAVNFQRGGRIEVEEKCVGLNQSIPPDAFDITYHPDAQDPASGKICFKLPIDPYRMLRLVDAATGTFQDLASATYSFAPSWDTANPWRIIFAASTGLQQLDINRDAYWSFTTDYRDRGPVVSPDGTQVAVSYRQHNHWEVYTISTVDGRRRRITRSDPLIGEPFNSAAPAWSPDGSRIAFITDRRGSWEFWLMNADGTNQRPLLTPEVAAKFSIRYNGVDERLISWGK